jgi:hypothetical protein
MASPSDLLFTSSNYFSWKSCVEDILQSMGLYQVTLGTEIAPLNALKKIKWDNKNDKAYGLIKISIVGDLQFLLQGIETLDVAWKNMETMFRKQNEI